MIMRKFIYLYVGIVLSLLCSCHKKEKVKGVTDLVNSELFFEEMIIEPLLGNPYQMEILDSILIIADFPDDHTLLLYNLNDSSYRRRLLEGGGPNDVIAPLCIDVDASKKTVSVLQRQTGECRKYILADLYDSNLAFFQKTKMNSADRMVETDDGYIYMGFNEKGVILHIDANNQETVVEDFGKYDIDNFIDKYRLFQGRFSYSKKDDCLLFAPSYVSDIVMYTLQDGRWNTEVIFSVGNGRVESRIEEKDYGIYKDDINHCMDVCKSNDSFYVLYDGSDMGGVQKRDYRYVMCVDMKGNLNKIYKVNPTIRDICVSDDGVMYALMYSKKDGEPTIGKAILK